MRRTKIFILVFLGLLAGIGFGMAASAGNGPSPSAMINSVRVPFVANEGQVANPDVKYYAKTFGGTVYALSGGRIIYALPKYQSGKAAGSVVIGESLRGAFPLEPAGAGKSPVAVNSFIGNRPEKWKLNLPVFDRLDFGEVYEGISLLLSARGNNVEKIFVLSPGADPREIAFGFEGASDIEITPDGKLELQTALGAVYFTRPVAWQIDARGKSLPVAADYALGADGAVRFELGVYDRNNILVIDPLLASTFIGGGGADAVQAMVVDSQTNIYVAGYTASSDFPTTNTPYSSTLAGGQDVFVAKFDANLGVLKASTYLGGSSNEQATAIGLDADSRVWLAGYTESTNFPTSAASPMCATNNGGRDAFVAVLSSGLGTPFLGTYLGGSNTDYAAAIAMDNSSRRQYVVGYTESENFPVTNSLGYATNYNGARDAFVTLFSNEVTRAAYDSGVFIGGTNADEAADAVLTPGMGSTNFVYIVGSTSSTNFPITNAYQRIYGGGTNDAFISRLDALLTNISASTFLGGVDDDQACAVGLDLSNKVYVAGYTSSTNFPHSLTNEYLAGYTNAYRGGQDIFVSCFTNNRLTNLYASTYIGGTGDDVARCLVVDSNTNRVYVYLAGYTSSSNFPATINAYDRSYNGGEDAFALRLNVSLTNLYASTYLGGGANDRALALALGPESNTLFTAGITASSDFPASDAAYETAFRGGASDGFVTRFAASLAYGTLKWKKQIGGICSSPALTWDGTVVLGNSTSLFAFTRSGTERWQAVTTSSVADQSLNLEGLGVPSVGTNNNVYINTSNGKVYAIDSSSGSNNLIFSGADPTFWSSMAIGDEGKLFVGQDEDFYALSRDGASLWNKTLPSYSYSAPAIDSNGMIYAGNSVNPVTLYAYNSTGSTIRSWRSAGDMYSSPALYTNGTIYAAIGAKLYAFSPDGSTGFTWTADGDILSSPSIGANGYIYVGGGNSLHAFRPNGTTAKTWNLDSEVKSSPVISADGSIIVGSKNGFVYSCNPDGTTNWVFETDDYLQFQSPLIDSEGTIYVSDDITVFAIYGPQPPADSAWPMFRHDALRSGNQGMSAASFLRPAGLFVSKGGATNYVHVSWNASSNALNYELWRNTSNSTVGATRIRRLTQTNYNDSSVDPGRIYYYWLKVKTPVTLSAFSVGDSGGVPPSPPANVAASDGIPTNYVLVTWSSSSNATAYAVWRSQSDATNTAVEIGTTSATNYTDYAAQPGLRYYYWVKAGNSEAGESDFSAGDHGGIPCLPPSGLTASQGAQPFVALTWNSSTGDTYVVYRHTENNASAAGIITNTAGLTANDYSATPLRRYYYWVKATNEFGLSGFGDAALGWSLLAPPVSVSASSGSGAYPNLVRVSWIAGSTSATAHVIFRSENSDPSTAARQADVTYNDTATNYDDTAITRGVSYYYWVAAMNLYGTSSWTAASSPGGTAPLTPLDLSASDGTYSNMVQVIWNSSAGATYYIIYRYETYDSSQAVQIGTASTTSYDDTSAVAGTLYYYWVKAANNSGISDLSTFNSGWRGLTPPANVSATDGSSTSEVTVAWSDAGAASYEIWRGTSDSVASARKLVNNVSSVYYNDSSAMPGTVYYYWVKSKRGNYSSAFSLSDYGYVSVGLLDIGVSDFVFVPTVLGSLAHPSAVSFNIANLGASDMVEPNNTLQYDFYLARTATFNASDACWFGSTNSAVTLKAGASTRVALSSAMRSVISIPEWAVSNYYVFVFVNHCLPSAWLDPNLANNIALRTGDSIRIASFTASQPVWNDYDGDGKTDFAVYNPSATSGQAGWWKAWLSVSDYAQVSVIGLGGAGYNAVPRDYDGDGKFDPAVYQPAGGVWQVCISASGYQTVLALGWGGTGQSAVPADYDGDGKVDPAVYQEAVGTWRMWLSGTGYAEVDFPGMGGSGWQAVPADYDGDGHADPAVYQEGTWRVWLSGSGYQQAYVINWGGSGQRPVPADYDGDGLIDPAVYQESAGTWRVWASSNGYRESSLAGYGGSGQRAVPGDYDADGRVDLVVYWESMGIWRLWLSIYGYSEMDVLLAGGEGFSAITFWE